MNTKGMACVFTNEDNEIVMYNSPQFESDMNLVIYGTEFLERLQMVENTSDFIKQMREFNEDHFDYEEDMMLKSINYTKVNSIHFKLSNTEGYNYIKNISNQSIIVECTNVIVLLKPSQILICRSGKMINVGKEYHLEKLEILNYSNCQQKKPYTIRKTETRAYEITVEAENEKEALQIAQEQISYGNYDEELTDENQDYFLVLEN